MKNGKIKKMLTIMCAVGVTFSMAGCAGSQPAAESVAEKPEESVSETTVESVAETAEINAAAETPAEMEYKYSLVQNVYSWGSSYSKIIISVDFTSGEDYANTSDYEVTVKRTDASGQVIGEGSRVVTAAYRSDAEGKNTDDGAYVTLDLAVTANLSNAQPYYTNPETSLKAWADCDYTVTFGSTGETWAEPDTVYHPDEEAFKTDTFTGTDITYPYAYYEVEDDGAKHPLIVWLHGQGSGGTDIGFVTGGMLVTNFVSEEVQDIFGGAYVLLPQAETIWMDGGNGDFTTDGNTIYTESLMEMINSFIADHENIDTSRIYVGGCSNGGFETIDLLLENPDTFAAAFPVCEAYMDEWITDEDVASLADTPIWMVHCTTDPVVDISKTSEALYKRLVEVGAENVHLTTYDSITDPDYGNAYIGHFAWVYSLKNMCTTDYDGSAVTVDGNEVTLYEWVAAQAKD